MAGYDHGEFEAPLAGSDEEARRITEQQRQRRLDPNGAWQASGLDDGAVLSDQFGQDAARYRALGHAATQNGPVQIDQTAAQQSRGLQMGGLGLLMRQANGTAPSSAAILSQRANQNATRAAGQQVAGARGPGAAIAAFGGANSAATGQAMAANAQNAQMRAGEISRGQGAFTQGAGAVRGQDLGAATTNAQLDAENRKLAEQQQQKYERMAWDTRNAEMQAANDAINQNTLANQQQRQARAVDEAADAQKRKDVLSAGLGALSDPRAKMHIGSLGHLMRRK